MMVFPISLGIMPLVTTDVGTVPLLVNVGLRLGPPPCTLTTFIVPETMVEVLMGWFPTLGPLPVTTGPPGPVVDGPPEDEGSPSKSKSSGRLSFREFKMSGTGTVSKLYQFSFDLAQRLRKVYMRGNRV